MVQSSPSRYYSRQLPLVVGCGYGCVVGAHRCGVVSAMHGLVGVSICGRITGSRRSGVASLVGCAIVGCARGKSTAANSGTTSNTTGHLGVTESSIPLLAGLAALPELDTTAASVAVARTRAELLLLLVVTAKSKLDEGGDEEEETADRQLRNSWAKAIALTLQ